MAEKTTEGKIYIYWIEYDRTEKGPIFNYYSYKATSDRQLRHYQKRAADETLTEYIANSFIKKNKWLPYSMTTREDVQQEAYLGYMEAKQSYDNREGSREAFFFNAIYKHLYKKYQEANNIERRIDSGRYYLEYKQGYTEVFAEPEPELYHKPALKEERAQEIEAEKQGLDVITYQRYQEHEAEEAGQEDKAEPEFFSKNDFNERVFGGVSISRLFAGEEYETIYYFDKVNLTYPRRRPARMKLKTAGFVKGITNYPCSILWPPEMQPGAQQRGRAKAINISDITIRPMNFKEDNGEKEPKSWEPYYKLVTTNRTARKFTNLDPDSELPKARPLEYVSVNVKTKFMINNLKLIKLPLISRLKVKGRGFKIIEYHSEINDSAGKLYKISIRELMKRADRKHTDLNYENRLIRDLSEFEPFITEKGFNSNYDDLCREAWRVIDTFPDQQRRLFELYYKNNEVIINTKNKQKILFDSFSVNVHDDRKITDSDYMLSENIRLKYTLKSIAKILKIRYANVLNLHSQGVKELSRYYINESSKKFPGTFKKNIM